MSSEPLTRPDSFLARTGITVAVGDGVKQRGVAQKGDLADLQPFDYFDLVSLHDAINRDWPNDKTICCYLVRDEQGSLPSRHPRFCKTALPALMNAGCKPTSWGVGIDFDLKDSLSLDDLRTLGLDSKSKVAWTPELLERFWSLLQQAQQAMRAKNFAPAVIHTTPHGLRAYHLFAADVSPPEAEEITAGLHAEYRRLGLVADAATRDWSRLFYLPKTVRDGKQCASQWWYRREITEDWTVPELAPRGNVRSAITPASSEVPTGESDIGPPPTAEEVQELLEVLVGGKLKKTELADKVRKVLRRRGKDKLVAFIDGLSTIRDNRNSNLISLAGQISAQLCRERWASPQLGYALLLQLAEQFEADKGDPDWRATLWRQTCYCWSRDLKRIAAEAAQKQAEVAEILQNARTRYPDHRRLHGNDAEALFELARMSALKEGDRYWLLCRDGRYITQPCSSVAVSGTIKDLGMESLVPAEGKPEQILQDRVRDVSEKIFSANGEPAPIASFEETPAGEVKVSLTVPAYKRRALPGTRHEDIAAYLAQFAGELCPLLELQIGEALHVESSTPLAATLFTGERDAGKTLITKGVASAFVSAAAVPGDVAFSRFNAALLTSPIVHCDESFPPTAPGQSLADMFRERIASSACVWVEAKGRERVKLFARLRYFISMNDLDYALSQLAPPELSQESRRALADRFVHLPVQPGTAEWLARKGGMRYTRGWLPDNQAPDEGGNRFAEYAIWCFEHRAELRAECEAIGLLQQNSGESRMLVPGNLYPALERADASLSVPVKELVVPLVEMFTQASRTDLIEARKSVALTADNKLVFLASEIKDTATNFYRAQHFGRVDNAVHVIEAAINRITVGGMTPERSRINGRRGRWRELRVDVVTTLLRQHEQDDLADALEAFATGEKTLIQEAEEIVNVRKGRQG